MVVISGHALPLVPVAELVFPDEPEVLLWAEMEESGGRKTLCWWTMQLESAEWFFDGTAEWVRPD